MNYSGRLLHVCCSRYTDNRDPVRQEADGEDKEHAERRSSTEVTALILANNLFIKAGLEIIIADLKTLTCGSIVNIIIIGHRHFPIKHSLFNAFHALRARIQINHCLSIH